MAIVARSGLLRFLLEGKPAVITSVSFSGGPGAGSGKGGGGGGSIRDAGGAFGKKEAANEEQYFRKQQKEQLEKLRDDLHDEIKHHEKQIEHHEELLKRLKNRLHDLGKS